MIGSENVSIFSSSDLIMLLLVRADGLRRAMPTMPLSEIGAAVKELAGLDIPAVKVFARGELRDRTGVVPNRELPTPDVGVQERHRLARLHGLQQSTQDITLAGSALLESLE